MKERRAKQFELPALESARLREIAAARTSGSAVLLNATGDFDRTSLTTALSRATARSVYRVDLGSVISKYIGETEKNLARMLIKAEEVDAILLFDEADALFGKRSAVRDSHDRYANQQAGHLLALIEQYDGMVLLATNMQVAVDPVLRRFLAVVVESGD